MAARMAKPASPRHRRAMSTLVALAGMVVVLGILAAVLYVRGGSLPFHTPRATATATIAPSSTPSATSIPTMTQSPEPTIPPIVPTPLSP
jgi:hypothetical protein